MKTKIYIIAAVLFSLALSIKAQNIDKEEFEKAKQDILTNLKLIEDEVISHLRHNDKENAYDHIEEIKHILNELSENTESQVIVYPMENDKFVSLLETVDNEHMDSDKKKIISLSATDNFFMMSQLIQLLQKFTFDQDRIDIVEQIYPKVLDTENNHQLFKYFTFPSSKEKLENIIKNNQSQIK